MAEDDWHNPDKTIATLAGEIAALRCFVEAIIGNLPERAMYAIAREPDWQNSILQDMARQKQTDPARDMAAGFAALAGAVRKSIDQDLADGGRLRTVQPFPLDPTDRINPEGDW